MSVCPKCGGELDFPNSGYSEKDIGKPLVPLRLFYYCSKCRKVFCETEVEPKLLEVAK